MRKAKTWRYKLRRVSQFGVSHRRNSLAMTTMSCRSFEALAIVALAFKKVQLYHEGKKRDKVRIKYNPRQILSFHMAQTNITI